MYMPVGSAAPVESQLNQKYPHGDASRLGARPGVSAQRSVATQCPLVASGVTTNEQSQYERGKSSRNRTEAPNGYD